MGVFGIEYGEIAKLLIGGQLTFKEGKIELLGEGVTFVPLTDHIAEIKYYENMNAENGIYIGAKYTGLTWNEKMLTKYKTKTPREIFEWGNKVMNLAGYGEFKVYKENKDRTEWIWRIYNSQIAEAYLKKYGKAKWPVCHRVRGYFAGAASFVARVDLDAVEVKCKAKGDSYCEFVIKKNKKFNIATTLVKKQLKDIGQESYARE
ncbi:MAG: hypothetical protein HYW05_03260 [Candidatus Diapherotrites archaeon]|nr:hypothetical protein [Candidatus Diapherotrites archaeon]